MPPVLRKPGHGTYGGKGFTFAANAQNPGETETKLFALYFAIR